MDLADAELEVATRPLAFTMIEGCVLLDDALTSHQRTVSKHLARCEGDVARVESLVNRRFIVAHLLDPVVDPPLGGVFGMTPEIFDAISRVARSYADNLKTALQREFPEGRFRVDVVGADWVEEEPLEVCVTFSRPHGESSALTDPR